MGYEPYEDVMSEPPPEALPSPKTKAEAQAVFNEKLKRINDVQEEYDEQFRRMRDELQKDHEETLNKIRQQKGKVEASGQQKGKVEAPANEFKGWKRGSGIVVPGLVIP